jgi:hypothetical protein
VKQEVDFKKGINSFQLKYWGIFFMTLDHIGAYVLNLTMGNHQLRIFFLYLLSSTYLYSYVYWSAILVIYLSPSQNIPRNHLGICSHAGTLISTSSCSFLCLRHKGRKK